MAEARGFSLLERFELKYHIPVAWADMIGQMISPYCEEDYYSKITPGGFYWITNLYLDSPNWTFLGWRNARLNDRFNMRVRTYGEHPDNEGTFHFEVKRKIGPIGFKSRATIKGQNPGEIFVKPRSEWKAKGAKDMKYLEEYLYKANTFNAHPRLLTQYKRRAWFSTTEEYSRVTIDTGMRFREETGWDYSVDPRYMHSTGLPKFFAPGADAVLELKCPCKQVPLWMMDLIHQLNLKQSGFSKFGNAAMEWKSIYEGPKGFKHANWTPIAGNFNE